MRQGLRGHLTYFTMTLSLPKPNIFGNFIWDKEDYAPIDILKSRGYEIYPFPERDGFAFKVGNIPLKRHLYAEEVVKIVDDFMSLYGTNMQIMQSEFVEQLN